MIVLGIESSCDETAVAVVDDKKLRGRRIISNIVLSQISEHKPYGGVVPEIAARSHLQNLDQLVCVAMKEAGISFDQLDGVAVTGGPGLIGGVIVGVMSAKTIAMVYKKPFLAINHLEAHALTARLTSEVSFPYLLLLISGGHTQLLIVNGVGKYQRLGTTLDDALGEAFDKCAKLMGLGYPGGPALEKRAKRGNGIDFRLPRPMLGRPGCDFSFSGLKTALREKFVGLEGEKHLEENIDNLCAAFQESVADVVVDRCQNAIKVFKDGFFDQNTLVVAGGVAANQHLSKRLKSLAEENSMSLVIPPPNLCTDNGAMVAWAGVERLRLNLIDSLDFAPKPRWPLDGQNIQI